jgi:mRNA interferase RelE/StbE
VVEFLLGRLLDDPRRVGHPLSRELEGVWSARRGPYRVVDEIVDANREVHVLRIDHRADVFRPR